MFMHSPQFGLPPRNSLRLGPQPAFAPASKMEAGAPAPQIAAPTFTPMNFQFGSPPAYPQIGQMSDGSMHPQMNQMAAPPVFQADRGSEGGIQQRPGGAALFSTPSTGLNFAGLSPLTFQNPQYFLGPQSLIDEKDTPQPQSHLPAYSPPPTQSPFNFNFFSNFDFSGAASPAAAPRAEEPFSAAPPTYRAEAQASPQKDPATSTALPNGYNAARNIYDVPAPVDYRSPNPGYDPNDNGTRILTDGVRDASTKLDLMPLRGGAVPFAQDSREVVAELGNAMSGNDDPNRIPTFVKVRGLPANQDPRIVPKKKSKKSKAFCGCRTLKLF
eukprot:GEMP01030760.1.p1 GENE.GEMP01030760.1~~GEMP01030760.1.p1  ORF type:complete len:328 (+),score=68.70 GEMP01030760.1:172-1155(+)